MNARTDSKTRYGRKWLLGNQIALLNLDAQQLGEPANYFKQVLLELTFCTAVACRIGGTERKCPSVAPIVRSELIGGAAREGKAATKADVDYSQR